MDPPRGIPPHQQVQRRQATVQSDEHCHTCGESLRDCPTDEFFEGGPWLGPVFVTCPGCQGRQRYVGRLGGAWGRIVLRHPRCFHCGYDLAGQRMQTVIYDSRTSQARLGATCPECGHHQLV
jgi:hypothetical protein